MALKFVNLLYGLASRTGLITGPVVVVVVGAVIQDRFSVNILDRSGNTITLRS